MRCLVLVCLALQAIDPEPLPAPKAASALKMPATIDCQANSIAVLKVETSAKTFTLEIPAGVDFFPKPPGDLTGPVRRVQFIASTTIGMTAPVGVYQIRGFCGDPEGNVSFADCVLTVKGAAPPGPGPAPADPLTAELQTLLTADYGTDQLAAVKTMAALYRDAADLAKADGNTSVADFRAAVEAVAKRKLPDPKIAKELRARVAKEFRDKLPDDEQPMDKSTRDALVALFTKIAAALEALK